VVVLRADDQVPGPGGGAVGDAHRGPGAHDAQADPCSVRLAVAVPAPSRLSNAPASAWVAGLFSMGAEHIQGQPPARFQDAPRLKQCRAAIGKELQSELAEHDVEGIGAKRQGCALARSHANPALGGVRTLRATASIRALVSTTARQPASVRASTAARVNAPVPQATSSTRSPDPDRRRARASIAVIARARRH
jgi:hypothetical protein